MGSTQQEVILKDLLRLQEEITKVKSLPLVKNIGIKLRCVSKPPSSSPNRRLPFKPCYYRPPDAKPDQPESSHLRCARRRFSRVVLSRPLASSSTFAIHQSSSPSSPASSLSRPSPSSSSPSSTISNHAGVSGPSQSGYPPVLEQLAQTNGHALPPRPPITRPLVFKNNGLMTKAKRHEDPALDLHEVDRWEISQVLEDTTYNHPHTIIEIFVNPTGQLDGSILTMSEIRAIIRVLILRAEMEQYKSHTCFQVLAIVYVASKYGDNTDCRSGRIVQAHHNGKHLVIQWSKRFDFIDERKAAMSLDTFLRYYLSEPVKTKKRNKRDGGSWMWLSKWNMRRKTRRGEASDGDNTTVGSESKEDLSLWDWFTKKFSI